MKLGILLTYLALIAAALLGCTHYRATLLPQTDDSYKVLGEGASVEQARSAAQTQATRTCRLLNLYVNKLSESQLPSKGNTAMVLWHFRCKPLQ